MWNSPGKLFLPFLIILSTATGSFAASSEKFSQFTSVPEPSIMILIGGGLIGLGIIGLKNMKK
jgi:hypothetical protein